MTSIYKVGLVKTVAEALLALEQKRCVENGMDIMLVMHPNYYETAETVVDIVLAATGEISYGP